jgi:hypothetical protein
VMVYWCICIFWYFLYNWHVKVNSNKRLSLTFNIFPTMQFCELWSLWTGRSCIDVSFWIKIKVVNDIRSTFLPSVDKPTEVHGLPSVEGMPTSITVIHESRLHRRKNSPNTHQGLP